MLPNFVSRMWLTDANGGAVAAIYGPSEATFKTSLGDVTITCVTQYPFDETLTFTVKGVSGATIPLTLRIPAWCGNASLTMNGAAVNFALTAGTFVKVAEAVKDGDVITLTLPMTIQKTTLEGQGIYFQRGPLLLSYAIPQKMEEDLTEYTNMHGKKPENADFKCWNITPAADFNYAYADDRQPLTVSGSTIGETEGAIPFDASYTPFKLRIPVKQIKWELEDGCYTPRQPQQGQLKLLSEETKYIDLIPYGCTELRLTVFPDVDAKPVLTTNEPVYTRPADAPSVVAPVEGHYYAYFELPRFCWDQPIYCKARTADDSTTDLHDNQGGDKCTMVGTTANGRLIWQWIGQEITEQAPKELIFTNHDLLTDIMPFAQGGYYNYKELLYKTEQTSSINLPTTNKQQNTDYYDLLGRRRQPQHSHRAIYIQNGKKVVR